MEFFIRCFIIVFTMVWFYGAIVQRYNGDLLGEGIFAVTALASTFLLWAVLSQGFFQLHEIAINVIVSCLGIVAMGLIIEVIVCNRRRYF